jgi:tetratricopeptide (TPR) repeat protein
MVYPGSSELSAEAQERVMAAFRQAVAKLQESQREEAMIGLEFVLRLDPTFKPAVNLHHQLSSGAQEIDLTEIVGQLQAPTSEAIDELLIDAVESFNERSFLEAKSKVEKVLLELPGHQDARQLLAQIDDALKVENQVGQFLAQAREALDSGDPQEAANFVMMAQALDPHHSGIAPALQEVYAARGGPPQESVAPAPGAADTVAFETSDQGLDEDFGFSEPAIDEELQPPVVSPPSEPDFGTPSAVEGGSGVAPWDDSAPEEAAAEPDSAFQPVDWSSGDEPSHEALATDLELDTDPPAAAEVAGLFLDEPEQAAAPVGDDLSDLFDDDGSPEPADGALEPEEQQAQDLVRAGQTAFESGDYRAAIDAWSRVYLIDPSNVSVSPQIEEAKQHLRETDRRIEHLLLEAREAQQGGEEDKALALTGEILTLRPQHPQATELRQLLGAGDQESADQAEVDEIEMPELEAGLFEEEIDEPAIDAYGDLELDWEQPAVRRVFGLPIRTLAIVVAGVAGVAIALWIGLGLLGGPEDEGATDVYALRANAEELFRQGQVEEALVLVRSFTATDPTDEQVVNRLIEKYQKALAPPTPTPIPASLIAARALQQRGFWLHAYIEAMEGLSRAPQDTALLEIKQQVEENQPQASILYTSLANSNYQTAASIASDLLVDNPTQVDIEEVFERSTFNAALAELRAYNLTGAEGYLRELEERQPDDAAVVRILEFIGKYKSRPADMQLQVFIGSINQRARQDLLAEDQQSPAQDQPGTPVPAEAEMDQATMDEAA